MTQTLNWDVKEQKVYSSGIEAPGYKALHRSDDNHLLNIVKDSYFPTTNEKFMETANKMSEVTGMPIEGYSEFGRGGKVLVYFKNDGNFNIGGFDTKNYMVLGNSFDYSSGLYVGLVNKVMRCSNEFGAIIAERSIRHSRGMNEKIDQLILDYQGYASKQRELKETFEYWQGIKMTPELKELFVNEVLEIDVKSEQPISTKKQNVKSDLYNSITREIEDMGNNLWAVFNGVTHYTTHVKPVSERVFGNILGSTANFNNRGVIAAKKVVELV